MTRYLINTLYGLALASCAVGGLWVAATGSPVQGLILLAIAAVMAYGLKLR
jgi:hypothetical protein